MDAAEAEIDAVVAGIVPAEVPANWFVSAGPGINLPTIEGTDGPDKLVGTDGDDRILGLKGDARIVSRDGDDFMTGGAGADHYVFDQHDGTYTGAAVEAVRAKLSHRRGGLQRRGTKAAKRRLKRLFGKQRRFQTRSNHCISKAIVLEAKRSGRAISLEDLKGIRSRVKARASQRARLHNWGFGQLRSFVAYKARLAGVPILFVDPRNTSRVCPVCGCVDKKNRPDQATFPCVSCGHQGHADHVAAVNIRSRALAAVTPRAVLGA